MRITFMKLAPISPVQHPARGERWGWESQKQKKRFPNCRNIPGWVEFPSSQAVRRQKKNRECESSPRNRPSDRHHTGPAGCSRHTSGSRIWRTIANLAAGRKGKKRLKVSMARPRTTKQPSWGRDWEEGREERSALWAFAAQHLASRCVLTSVAACWPAFRTSRRHGSSAVLKPGI